MLVSLRLMSTVFKNISRFLKQQLISKIIFDRIWRKLVINN